VRCGNRAVHTRRRRRLHDQPAARHGAHRSGFRRRALLPDVARRRRGGGGRLMWMLPGSGGCVCLPDGSARRMRRPGLRRSVRTARMRRGSRMRMSLPSLLCMGRTATLRAIRFGRVPAMCGMRRLPCRGSRRLPCRTACRPGRKRKNHRHDHQYACPHPASPRMPSLSRNDSRGLYRVKTCNNPQMD
jgi:hypothetical protein